MESSKNTVEISRKKMFCVYKTISALKMFKWTTVGEMFWLFFCRKVDYFSLERDNPLSAVVKNVLCIMVQIYPGVAVDTLKDLGGTDILNRSNQSWFKIQLDRWPMEIQHQPLKEKANRRVMLQPSPPPLSPHISFGGRGENDRSSQGVACL